MSYYPKRPVKSFQDLEVYQKLLAIAVAVAKRIGRPRADVDRDLSAKSLPKADAPIAEADIADVAKNLHDCVLSLPIKIAAAHSLRFGNSEQAIRILEEIMVGCNKTVVYLELYRDLYNGTGNMRSEDKDNAGSGTIELEFFDEQIKTILSTRFKILHLQRSWIKFTPLTIKTEKSYGKTKK